MMVVIQFSIFFLPFVAICLADSSCKPDEIAGSNDAKLAAANNELAFNLFKRLASETSKNIFFSPLSLSTAFGMLYYGARGETAQELRQALGYEAAGLPEELVHSTFKHYLTQTLPSEDASSYVLNSANAALLDTNVDVNPCYKKGINNYYQGTVKDVDFASANEAIIQGINDWVKDKTNGKIDQLLDHLDPSTLFVLLNAIYFKGTWKTKFDESNTKPQNFYNDGLVSKASEIPMMKLTEKFRYTSSFKYNVKAIEIPYKGENISMMVLLPYERDGLENLENNLSLEALQNIRQETDLTEVFLTLPKFKVEYSREMSSDFMALGAKSIFSPGADLSGIIKSKGVYVSQVLHKAVLEVNEEGSEAAAATAIIAVFLSSISDTPSEMIVDHPFLFVIVDTRNDMMLFIGRITDL